VIVLLIALKIGWKHVKRSNVIVLLIALKIGWKHVKRSNVIILLIALKIGWKTRAKKPRDSTPCLLLRAGKHVNRIRLVVPLIAA